MILRFQGSLRGWAYGGLALLLLALLGVRRSRTRTSRVAPEPTPVSTPASAPTPTREPEPAPAPSSRLWGGATIPSDSPGSVTEGVVEEIASVTADLGPQGHASQAHPDTSDAEPELTSDREENREMSEEHLPPTVGESAAPAVVRMPTPPVPTPPVPSPPVPRPPAVVSSESVAAPDVEHHGHQRVEAVLESLERLDDLPLEEHVEVYEAAHAELRAALTQQTPQSQPASSNPARS